MATSTYSTLARRMGAKASMAALAKIKDVINEGGGKGGYHALDPVEAARMLIEGAGEKLSPRMEGYLAALGEYIGQTYEGALPEPALFLPLAAMTDEDVAAERQEWARYMASPEFLGDDYSKEVAHV